MFKKLSRFGMGIAIGIIFLAGCAAPQPSMPTPDLNLVRTEAVVTALAQMTRQAVLNPEQTQTPLIPTVEPLVTSTPLVTTAAYYGGSGVYTGGTSGSGSISGTPIPTWTPIIYGAVFVTQNYLDGYVCQTGEQLDFKVTLQNIGQATWDTTHYYIKRLYNNPDIKLTNHDQYALKEDVYPGSKGTFTVDISCPTYPGGPWTTQWGVVNNNGDIFAKFYFRFYTRAPGTATPVKTRTPSPG